MVELVDAGAPALVPQPAMARAPTALRMSTVTRFGISIEAPAGPIRVSAIGDFTLAPARAFPALRDLSDLPDRERCRFERYISQMLGRQDDVTYLVADKLLTIEEGVTEGFD